MMDEIDNRINRCASFDYWLGDDDGDDEDRLLPGVVDKRVRVYGNCYIADNSDTVTVESFVTNMPNNQEGLAMCTDGKVVINKEAFKALYSAKEKIARVLQCLPYNLIADPIGKIIFTHYCEILVRLLKPHGINNVNDTDMLFINPLFTSAYFSSVQEMQMGYVTNIARRVRHEVKEKKLNMDFDLYTMICTVAQQHPVVVKFLRQMRKEKSADEGICC